MFVDFSITTTAETPVTLDLNGDTYPFTEQVDTHCEMSDRPTLPKLLAPGQTPVYTFAKNRIWHVEGHIIGADMAGYDTARLALLNAALPIAVPTTFYTAIITVSDENGNSYTSNATLTSYSMPEVPLSPAYGAYMLEWESDDPFVYRVSDSLATYV